MADCLRTVASSAARFVLRSAESTSYTTAWPKQKFGERAFSRAGPVVKIHLLSELYEIVDPVTFRKSVVQSSHDSRFRVVRQDRQYPSLVYTYYGFLADFLQVPQCTQAITTPVAKLILLLISSSNLASCDNHAFQIKEMFHFLQPSSTNFDLHDW